MTATLPPPTALRPDLNHNPFDATWAIGAPRLLAGLSDRTRVGYAEHTAIHDALHGRLPAVDLDRLLAALDQARMTGRGGAGFPTATKLRALPGRHSTVVVNGTESEPASRKDRVLLRRAPHVVLDGALRVAQALGTEAVTVAVHDELLAAEVRAAVAQRPDGRRVRVTAIGGGFVAGEARALVRGLTGATPVPPGRRTPPTADGVLVANAETFAQIAVLLRLGPARFAATGTRDEPGTTLLTLGGALTRPGVVEVPLGTPLHLALSAAGAAPVLSQVITGGYHGTWLRGDADVRLSRADLATAGATLGAGVVLALDPGTCALGELARVASWLAAESARQCGPCRFGLPALAADVEAARRGDPRAVAAALAHGRAVTGRGACSHPDGAARFVASALAVLGGELDAHAERRCHRPVQGRLPIGARA